MLMQGWAHHSSCCRTHECTPVRLARLGWRDPCKSLDLVLQYADAATVEKREDAAEQVVKQAKLKAIERLLWGADADPLTVEPGELSCDTGA